MRITVRAGEAIIVREGIGTGVGRSSSADVAHEIALKAAETDATKRALATFGNPFGLALYDKEQRGVTKRSRNAPATAEVLPAVPHANFSLILRHSGSRTESFDSLKAFVSAIVKAVCALPTTEAVCAFLEANLDSLAALPRPATSDSEDPVQAIGSALKTQLRVLARGHASESAVSNCSQPYGPEMPAQLLIPKEKRIRDKAHLAFVAKEPCLVCGRRPAQAHHIRFAQPRGLGLKVSDEFAVPLCNGHHDSLHRTGDERAWWARNGILDPLKFAARLWAASRQRSDGDEPEGPPSSGQPERQGQVLSHAKDQER